jgi:hypothetical protein
MILCNSSVRQRNGSVFLLNHETEACMKEEYTITYITGLTKVSAIKNMACIVKETLSLSIF